MEFVHIQRSQHTNVALEIWFTESQTERNHKGGHRSNSSSPALTNSWVYTVMHFKVSSFCKYILHCKPRNSQNASSICIFLYILNNLCDIHIWRCKQIIQEKHLRPLGSPANLSINKKWSRLEHTVRAHTVWCPPLCHGLYKKVQEVNYVPNYIQYMQSSELYTGYLM